MRYRALSLLAIAALMALLGALMPRTVQAADYYWRWTSAPDAECGQDGNDYLFTGPRNYEYNLPTGASLNEYIIDNGASSFQGNFPAPSGTGTGSFADDDVNGPDPFTYAYQFETVIGGKIVYRSTLTFACTLVGKGLTLTVTITNEEFSSGGAS